MRRLIIISIISLSLVATASLYFWNQSKTVEISRTTSVEIKSNAIDSSKNDVYLVDESTGKRQFVMTIGVVNVRDIHAEFWFQPIIKLDDKLWVESYMGQQVTSILVLDPKASFYRQYDLMVENVLGCDFAFNASQKQITYGSFCPLEVDDVTRAVAQGIQASLYVYDLETTLKRTITTGIAKQYNPVWLNDETLEYDSPNGTGRVKVSTLQ